MDEESFLARWSRRKSAAGSGPDREATPPAPEAAPPPAEAPVPPERDKAAEDEIAALPPIDSLTAESDFKPFLRPGVPGELQSAALRKLWRSDPSWAAPEVLDLH